MVEQEKKWCVKQRNFKRRTLSRSGRLTFLGGEAFYKTEDTSCMQGKRADFLLTCSTQKRLCLYSALIRESMSISAPY